jgi:hypothetical protein
MNSLNERLFVEKREARGLSAIEKEKEQRSGVSVHWIDNLEVYLHKISDLTITGDGERIP